MIDFYTGWIKDWRCWVFIVIAVVAILWGGCKGEG